MPLFALLQAGCLLAFALLLVAAGWQDVRTMRIANRLSIAVACLFLVWALAGMAGGSLVPGDMALAVTCAIAVFLVGAAAFAASVLGGGDVKLLAAASLFAGPALLLDFLTIVALAGGLVGIAVLAGAPIGPAAASTDGTTVRARLRTGLPYGPAIAAGGLWVAARLIAPLAGI
ncbi:MAG: prepilin peptidase [Proteobacteria bacterium]|nr:prepilin peptidase [Pseudomonadota bacterium]